MAVPLHIRLSAPASGRRRRTGDATAGFPNRNKEWWTERIALDCEDEGQPNGEFLSDSVTEHVEVSKACTDGPALKAKLETPPDKLSSLFGVCGCKSMDEGCFYDGNLGLNPVVTLKNATVIGDSGCPPGHGRVGPVIIPYYPMLLPDGTGSVKISQPAQIYDPTQPLGCTITFTARIPPWGHQRGCDFCEADQCFPTALDQTAEALGISADPGGGAGDGEDPADTTTAAPQTLPSPDTPFPVAAIVVLSVGSAAVLGLLGVRLWRRRQRL